MCFGDPCAQPEILQLQHFSHNIKFGGEGATGTGSKTQSGRFWKMVAGFLPSTEWDQFFGIGLRSKFTRLVPQIPAVP